ncbi:DUF4382 domain-containing protein [Christiangramia echinicola]|uniref:Carboxypeptidase regulatory-like domain-containing protein n=1 Tax=Christiangramia echinicola TaxID=279359 RepID=A0A1H1MQI5_9FLAO|nr:DUF4382 domain-containing protein [Christiangramia echinicola]SDR88996.1 Carboxypeptidase regulatory-like domain-containing protein [Christiangramia echinicola]
MRYLKNVTLKSLMIATFISLGLTSCSEDDDSNPSGEGSANLTVRMTDAPGDYEAVFVDVQDIEIHVESDNETEAEADVDGDGWVSVGDVQTGVYDLLELTGGVSQLLADTEVPAGYVSQMRLILGSENSVIVDGVEKPLNTPSAQQSGLKLQLNQNFEAGENYAFLLDFDVDKSIVETGNGGYNLKPVIRLSAEADAGMVVGKVVVPADIDMSVQTLVILTGESTTISAYTDAEGNFALNGVPAGVYSLEAIPEADANLSTFAIGTVEVKPNETTDLGELTL